MGSHLLCHLLSPISDKTLIGYGYHHQCSHSSKQWTSISPNYNERQNWTFKWMGFYSFVHSFTHSFIHSWLSLCSLHSHYKWDLIHSGLRICGHPGCWTNQPKRRFLVLYRQIVCVMKNYAIVWVTSWTSMDQENRGYNFCVAAYNKWWKQSHRIQ